MASVKKKAAVKPAPAEEDEDEDVVELEELDADVEEEETEPQEDPIWGVNELIKLLKKKTGKEYKPREVRTQLRKMARDGTNRVKRNITPDNRTRYAWTGPEDKEVLRIIAAVTGGEIEKGKKEALDKLKADKAAQRAAAGDTPVAKKAKKKAATKVIEPEDEDDLDDLEDDEDDE